MEFPLNINCQIDSYNGHISRNISISNPFTCILGPNGSGKTHLLRSLKNSFQPNLLNGKFPKFISAGRIGNLELNRSDSQGHGYIDYENLQFGDQSQAQYRHGIETLNGNYQTLAKRPDILLKIQERLQKLFKRNILLSWNAGYLKVNFTKLDGTQPYTSAREASGLMHLVGLLAAIYDDEIGALFIDEPEVSLHPQLQAFLLNEMLNVVGIPRKGTNHKLIIIATHSTEMLKISKPEDLTTLIFCNDLNEEPVQIDPNEGTLQNKKIKSLIAKLGQEHKLTLFSRRPLLVEGPSDVVICNTIANKINIFLEASGSQILPVIGKDEFPVVTKLFKLLGKEPVILADADAIADGIELINQLITLYPDIDDHAASLGVSKTSDLLKSINSDFAKLVESNWVDIQIEAEKHAYWINGYSDDEIKAKKRSAFSTLFSLEDREIEKINEYRKWINIKSRYLALLDLFEKIGIFILRKGSIEAYYNVSDKTTSSEKIDAAIDEIAYINGQESNVIESQYHDITRCLMFAAATDPISEAQAIKDNLLAVITPCIAKLQDSNNKEDLNLFINGFIPDKASLFSLERSGNDLVVNLKSNIIEAKCFPLIINKDDDVIKKVNMLLQV
ncbi:ATP-dependent nuclease [Acinetobacter bereziniae]|uniref:ATP-dependent nuclease n=1 Tax=Acinetobacter bereziniae TaxID=106648 RepID=UPI001250A8E0|nr:AAA family ATPase [Acinetobacter bereziniae]MBJ9903148.1 AAA family ATPase [Acinetobacter bereziniae]MCU4321612.1 AAA family ATPase [Acinetobacter bereziniae]MCU4598238.1 AAA family ATPase [Acinetobacter bereziniae]